MQGAFLISLSKHGVAVSTCKKFFGDVGINSKPVSFNVDENVNEGVINFSYEFNNDKVAETYFDYTVTINSGDAVSVSVNGEVISKGVDTADKLKKSNQFADGLNLFSYVSEFYKGPVLDPKPISFGRSANQTNGSVSLNAEFGQIPEVKVSGLESISYTISATPSLRVFDSQSRINGNGIYSHMILTNY